VPPVEAGASFELTVLGRPCGCRLVERGVEIVTGPQDRPWGMRTAAFLDTDGYVWEIAAAIPSA
jgi:uncharacterized glyoxalase superfamily protein PhnB